MTIVNRRAFEAVVPDEVFRRHIIEAIEDESPDGLNRLREYLEMRQLASHVALPAEYHTFHETDVNGSSEEEENDE
jgi:hypothetical protein